MKKYIAFILLFSFVFPVSMFAETDTERRERLESTLKKVEQQIIQQRILVDEKRGERQSLERDLTIIDGEIRKAQLGIQVRSTAIAKLSNQITDKEDVILILNERLDKQRKSLAELIRKTRSSYDFSLVEVMLSNETISGFFSEVDKVNSIKRSLNSSLSILQEIRVDTKIQKTTLEGKQIGEARMRSTQELEKKNIQTQESRKEHILSVTRGEEVAYQELLVSQQKTASQLKAQLFQLLGGGGPIPFPAAVAYAQVAEQLTGTPASLILAILEQESHFGANIGGCTMSDVSVGRYVMHPTRDKPPFLAIAQHLGFNPDTQQVSCPLIRRDGTRLGWGGAMGPSQFIPSTWVAYGGFVKDSAGNFSYSKSRDTIRSLLRKNTPSSPFINQDAFLATALLLRDNGSTGAFAADRRAALRYYAGWAGASRPENSFYGDQVMQRKARFVRDIRILAGN